MPYFHCSECHHEWEGREEDRTCDWCGARQANILEQYTPGEKLCNSLLSNGPEKFFVELRKR